MLAGILTWVAILGLFAFLGIKGYRAWTAEGKPSLRPRTSTVALFVIAGLVVVILVNDKSKPTTAQDRLDAEAQEYIRQHGAQVDRDLHEMKVRARAEEIIRGS